ncbi:MAG: ribonuclease P protein component [Pseudomonadota bacterium]
MDASASAPEPSGPAPLHGGARSVSAAHPLTRLKKRRDFLAASRARKWSAPGLVLQARPRKEEEARFAPEGAVRVGYTASKKVGDAVTRNRAKRRLRALAEPALATLGRAGWDYVLIARRDETAGRLFASLEAEFAEAVRRVHAPRKGADAQRRPR